ncbi:MAG: hypothetical protein D6709_02980 [Chloroflexi bacterium]|jgi:hypothetical protein|uniref:DUF3147 domain-containing protein n=1 Tax=Candidatus Thermofonsia Clade 3 bacterium TaxID=2364212 RepID=A0A2M8QE01_9CHLR|nr:hypothetical protein [Candidatus Roseilinea sp. NK_OTU-006]PJF47982.1 MAG: hypothetical protein CUN48_05920 [Candidatus Thermofonsia Clade 3 bacterium]RMG65291.1 MAG: hypothetical protein D6709_02980 [Chloroflexota bacterium]
MNTQKALPVIASIAIILGVAILRDRSKTLAAILATMPINIPLGLWVVFGGGNDDPDAVASFVWALVPGLLATIVWVIVVYGLLRLGVTLWMAILGAYAVWAVLVFAFIRVDWLKVPA